jgi:4-diphosphocytidyl-2-C-methyl-D-erythritol kinase
MLTLLSPAKVNLFLRVLGKRTDGYHELASLFQTVSLFDTLDFSFHDQDQLTCSDAEIPTDGRNLVLKAADLFRKKTGLAFGLKIHIDKKIPQQAGLGGGSSNAATTLWALNQMCGLPATINELILWSGEIGSDVTFFLSQGTAYCTGRGEIMQPMPFLRPQKLVIIKPSEGLSTPQVFKHFSVDQVRQRNPQESLGLFYRDIPDYYNDLEEAAFRVLPSLTQIKQLLHAHGAQSVMLAGSGSSLFCMGKEVLPQVEGCACFSVEFVNRTASEWYSG